MARFSNVLGTIGKTPLIRLNNIARDIKSTIHVKVDCFNPGGSIKDRIALVTAIKKYRCIFVMPDKMSRDKIDLLTAFGAEVAITPTAVSADSPKSYNGVADRLAKEIPGAYRPNQFTNPNNPHVHYLTTGLEIWQDSDLPPEKESRYNVSLKGQKKRAC